MANNTNALGRRSQEESARTRERILDEAEKLFSQLGLGVSIREIAKASGVRHHTIQHHFGDKEALYCAVLNRWDDELQSQLVESIGELENFGDIIDASIDTLFEFLLAKRAWVSLVSKSAAAAPGRPGQMQQKSWIQFIENMFDTKELGPLNLDVRLLMITVEGITHNHVLAQDHYMTLFGKDVTDTRLKNKTKAHIRAVVRSLLGVS